MAMSAPNPEPKPACVIGTDGSKTCGKRESCKWNGFRFVCFAVGRKKREVEPDAREKREAKPEASPEPQDINVRCRQVCQGGECFELCSFG